MGRPAEGRRGSPEGEHGEAYGHKEEGGNRDPQPQAQAPLPAQSAMGPHAAALFIFQPSELGRRALHWRNGTLHTMRARSRELAKSTPMTMATSTSRTAEAAG